MAATINQSAVHWIARAGHTMDHSSDVGGFGGLGGTDSEREREKISIGGGDS